MATPRASCGGATPPRGNATRVVWGRNPTTQDADVDAEFMRESIYDKETGHHTMLATCELGCVFLDAMERGIGMTAALEGAARVAIKASLAVAGCEVECAETAIMGCERDAILFNASERQCNACGAPSIACVYVHSELASRADTSRPWMCYQCMTEFVKGGGGGGGGAEGISRVWLVSAAELSEMKAVCG